MTTIDGPEGGKERLVLISSREFACTDPKTGKVFRHLFKSRSSERNRKWSEELREQLRNHVSDEERRLRAVFASPYYTLLPEHLLHPGDEARTLGALFTESFGEGEVRSEKAGVEDPSILYWYPSSLEKVLIEADPGYIPAPLSQLGIDALLRAQHRDGRPIGLLHIREGEADMGFAEDGRVLHFSSFAYRNAEELLYFFLSARKEKELEEKVDRVQIWGTTGTGAERELIERYIGDPVLHQDAKGNWSSFLFEER